MSCRFNTWIRCDIANKEQLRHTTTLFNIRIWTWKRFVFTFSPLLSMFNERNQIKMLHFFDLNQILTFKSSLLREKRTQYSSNNMQVKSCAKKTNLYIYKNRHLISCSWILSPIFTGYWPHITRKRRNKRNNFFFEKMVLCVEMKKILLVISNTCVHKIYSLCVNDDAN